MKIYWRNESDPSSHSTMNYVLFMPLESVIMIGLLTWVTVQLSTEETASCRKEENSFFTLWLLVLLLTIISWLIYGCVFGVVACCCFSCCCMWCTSLRRGRGAGRGSRASFTETFFDQMRQNDHVQRHAGGLIQNLEKHSKKFSGLETNSHNVRMCCICCEDYNDESVVS
jgi:hypothetical protein